MKHETIKLELTIALPEKPSVQQVTDFFNEVQKKAGELFRQADHNLQMCEVTHYSNDNEFAISLLRTYSRDEVKT